MSELPIIAQKSSFALEVERGKTYYWCQCGRSKDQPFCDGSHQLTSFMPVPFTAEENKTVYLCGCKQTTTQPFCNGNHTKL
jgi:CDGSH-type Zn-finger protein